MHGLNRGLVAFAFVALLSARAQAGAAPRTLCVYDPSGESGDFYKNTVPYALAALDWGVDFGHPQVRQDEKIASEDFRAGKCDAVIMTGVRARQFVPTAGTIEAIGAIQNYHALKTVVGALARPSEAKLMKNGEFESAGIFPAGSVYLFVHDRKVTDAAALAGLRIATFTYDEAASLMVQRVGAAAVSADTSTFSGMFNSGSVDVAYAPVTAYKPLELGKGVGTTGGVVHFPLAQLTFQVVIRSDKMPEGFGQASRTWLNGQFDTLMKNVDRAEKQVVAKQWLEIPNQQSYDALFQSVRVELGTRGVYDPVMLHKLKLVRCREDAARAECAEKKE
jgi:hypothetical protein